MRYGRGKEVYNGAEGPGRQAAKKTGLVRGCRTKPFIFSGGAGGRAGAREGPRRGQPRESSCAASAGVSPGAGVRALPFSSAKGGAGAPLFPGRKGYVLRGLRWP